MLVSRPSRKAFTLVELLVVIAIIGVLVALLLPAVQAAREAARRMECGNKIKQMALATHNYHDIHDKLPPGKVTTTPGTLAGDFRSNWAISILPFLEQQPLFDLYDHTIDNVDDYNMDNVNSKYLDIYACPSDMDVQALGRPESGPGSSKDFARGSYRIMCGRSEGHLDVTDGGWWDAATEYDGIPRHWIGAMHLYDGVLKCETMTMQDGASNSLMIGELHNPIGKPNRGTFWAYSYTSYNASGAVPYPATLKANDWQYCLDNVPNGQVCKRGWGSFHSGGGNWGLCDGSVRFISENINMDVYVGMASIRGGEPVALP